MSKRRNDDNTSENSFYDDTKPKHPKKRTDHYAEEKICCRFIIPSKFAGGLIGKKGAVINGLRDDYQVKVACPDANGPERLFRIMGGELDNVIDCIRDVAERLGPEMCTINRKLEKEHGADNGAEMRLLVNKNLVGGIIGAKGVKIKELRESSDCMINMHQECCPNSTDRIFCVSGDLDNVVDVLRTVIEQICELEDEMIDESRRPKDQMKYDPNNWNDMIRYGGIRSDGTERSRPGGRNDDKNDRKRPIGGHYPPHSGHYPGMYGAPPMYPHGGYYAPYGGHPNYPPHGYYPPPGAYAPYGYGQPGRNDRNNDSRRGGGRAAERKQGFGHGRR